MGNFVRNTALFTGLLLTSAAQNQTSKQGVVVKDFGQSHVNAAILLRAMNAGIKSGDTDLIRDIMAKFQSLEQLTLAGSEKPDKNIDELFEANVKPKKGFAKEREGDDAVFYLIDTLQFAATKSKSAIQKDIYEQIIGALEDRLSVECGEGKKELKEPRWVDVCKTSGAAQLQR